MKDVQSSRKLALLLAGASLAILLVMVVFSVSTGVSQEVHEHFAKPAEYAEQLLKQSHAVRVLFALDVAFLAVYTAFFAALAHFLRAHPFSRLALGFLLGTTLLDIVEDHHIVTMLDQIEAGLMPSATEISAQALVSACKFTLSYVALVLFGLAIPRTKPLAWALSLFLTVGTLTSAVIGYALPRASQLTFDQGRWVGFVVGLVLSIAWLASEKDGPVTDPLQYT